MEFTINGITYRVTLSLAQDELLAPITREMLIECPELLHASQELMLAAKGQDASSNVIQFGLDMMKINAWIYGKKYARRILAVLLVPEGREFDEADVQERSEIMGKHASREVAQEVINFFFIKSGVFTVGMKSSSKNPPQEATKDR